ncbi:hypothetical protein KKG48_01690 [Patescibacteria group bacterium]|nr:hypothetical protein [Patescibacteria group bacterium]
MSMLQLQNRMNKKTITILIGLTILAGALAFLVGKKSKEATPAKEIKTEVTEKIEGWQTYRNEGHRFDIKYPPEWILAESGRVDNNKTQYIYKTFGNDLMLRDSSRSGTSKTTQISVGPDKSQLGGLIWGVNINPIKEKDIEQIQTMINYIGHRFPDKKIIEETVFIDGIKARHFTAKSSDPDHYYSEVIIFENNGLLYSIGSNIQDDRLTDAYNSPPYLFKTFYESFRFID